MIDNGVKHVALFTIIHTGSLYSYVIGILIAMINCCSVHCVLLDSLVYKLVCNFTPVT
jgi:hypothetical protein